MNKEKVKQILEQYNTIAKKKFGQNFLHDENVLEKIVKESKIDKNTNVVEIGPGLGFLTNYLSKYANKVLCYEIDNTMVEVLKDNNYSNVEIILDDFLKRDLNKDLEKYDMGKEVVVVANLPYYITTPILLKILEETSYVKKMVVMMQKEVAKRLSGKPSTKDYNSLSVLIQYFTNPKILFDVKPNCFYPAPMVDSSILEVTYKDVFEKEAFDLDYFLKFNRNIFSNRRKTLLNNLTNNYRYSKEEISNLLKVNNIVETIRAEALSVDEIINLSNLFYKHFETNN